MSKINGFDKDGNMLQAQAAPEFIPPELVEKARALGYPDDKIIEAYEWQMSGCLEYHRDMVYDGFLESIGIDSDEEEE